MKPEGETKGLPNAFGLVMSVLTHVLLLAPVIYILSFFIGNLDVLFSWHPTCMVIGVGLLIFEGVFSISGEANLNQKVSRINRITIHWILHTIGLSLMYIGLIVIIINKNIHDKEHFTTLHGKIGLASVILATFVGLFGVLANNTRWLYPKVRPILLKVVHGYGGIGMTILFLITIINGSWNYAFPDNSTSQILVLLSFIIAIIIILFKPILGAIARTKYIIYEYEL
ncbi:transmembrane reductase CYB561D2-like isoform X2 [Aphidius gifuensis]|uniref:transmembrane reductase CYB561D2-like isoform X2 n=1 Tax=Aphidius gifuensis TaxID=684658 RepID=UPI001CDCC619|nr:transmembrane reductase CYB561D2-like isoform X2 [Aphidius gifuensis]